VVKVIIDHRLWSRDLTLSVVDDVGNTLWQLNVRQLNVWHGDVRKRWDLSADSDFSFRQASEIKSEAKASHDVNVEAPLVQAQADHEVKEITEEATGTAVLSNAKSSRDRVSSRAGVQSEIDLSALALLSDGALHGDVSSIEALKVSLAISTAVSSASSHVTAEFGEHDLLVVVLLDAVIVSDRGSGSGPDVISESALAEIARHHAR